MPSMAVHMVKMHQHQAPRLLIVLVPKSKNFRYSKAYYFLHSSPTDFLLKYAALSFCPENTVFPGGSLVLDLALMWIDFYPPSSFSTFAFLLLPGAGVCTCIFRYGFREDLPFETLFKILIY